MTGLTKRKKNLFYALAVFVITVLLVFAWGASGGESAQPPAEGSGKEAGKTETVSSGDGPDEEDPSEYGSSEVGVFGETEGTGPGGPDNAEEWAFEEAEAGEEWMEAAEAGEGEDDHDAELEYRVFSSRKMGFSFLYDAAHKAKMTDSGAAELTINGNSRFAGLSVSVADAADMPDVAQILEEEAFNAIQKYGDSLVQEPEQSPLELEGHTLTGILYIYTDKDGADVLCTYYIEQRDGKYAFFKTEGLYDGDGTELEALGGAVITLEFDPDIYGEGDVK